MSVATALAALGLLLSASPRHAAAQQAAPQTIPTLQEWTATPGTFTVTAATPILVEDHELRDVAETLADDVHDLTGHAPSIVTRNQPGAIRLQLGPVDVPADGYELSITPDQVLIAAPNTTGVFLGTRTILQLLVQNPALPAGTARDWPQYAERGLMVDIGRKHLSLDWLVQHVKELAWLRMNVLHLHLSDNQGFRIESESHPEIVSEVHLSKDDVRHLLAVADRYHVTVIPEIDMPGHMQQILAAHPEHQLVDVLGQPNPTALDITSDAARALAREIIEEYIDLFPGEYWHGGADEFIHPANQPAAPSEAAYPLYPSLLAYAQAEHGPTAVHKDAFLDFINWMNDVVASHGKTLRIWSDGIHGGSAVTVDADIVTEWWNWFLPNTTPSDLRAQGHDVVNAGWFPTYYATTSLQELPSLRPNLALAWDEWEVNEFWRAEDVFLTDQTGIAPLLPPHDVVEPDDPGLLGSKVHVWHDDPAYESVETTTANICPFLRLVAQKTWSSPTDASWSDLLARAAAIGRAPGFDIIGPAACASPTSVTLPAGVAAPPGTDRDSLPATGGGIGFAVVVVTLAVLLRRREGSAWTSG